MTMIRCCKFLSRVTILVLLLLLFSSSSSVTADHAHSRKLVFQPIGLNLTCPDGSPVGLYVESDFLHHSQNSPVLYRNPKRHVIYIQGGGGCSTPSDCKEGYQNDQFRFSSSANPKEILGDTFLSPDPHENPELHDATRFLIPYCTQDYFLGKGREIAKDLRANSNAPLIMNGLAIFRAVLQAWLDWTNQDLWRIAQNSQQQSLLLDQVTVVAVSSGTIAAMNLMPLIRATVGVRARQLRHIWDAPGVLSDRPYPMLDLKTFVQTYVDLDFFPYCDPNNYYSQLYSRASVLPCCLSVHCMIRHHPSFTYLFQPQNKDGKEKLLMIDSAYDYVELLAGDFFSYKNNQLLFVGPTVEDLASVYETAGNRKARSMETVAIAKSTALAQANGLVDNNILNIINSLLADNTNLLNNILNSLQNKTNPEAALNTADAPISWIYSSCLAHSFLLPAREFIARTCQETTQNTGSVKTVCRPDGIGYHLTTGQIQLGMTLWKTTETWKNIQFDHKSLRQIINEFLILKRDPNDYTGDTFLNNGPLFPIVNYSHESIDLRLDCEGISCRPKSYPKDVWPTCSSMLEIESRFKSVNPAWITIAVLSLIPLLVTCLSRCRAFRKLNEMHEQAQKYKERQLAQKRIETESAVLGLEQKDHAAKLALRGVTITTTDAANPTVLVDNVDFTLPAGGSITALCGRSGAGKSTLLRALSQLKLDLDVSIQEGEDQLTNMPKSYLRQGDTLAWDNVRPCDLILLNARVYGATPERTFDLYALLERLFHRGDGKAGAFNPFSDTAVGNLSGGQRRLVQIVLTLLLETDLLLMDEPLSGLDSVSSMELMEALNKIVEAKGISVVMVVHQPSQELLKQFDRLVVLNAGTIAHDGTVDKDGPVSEQEDIIDTLIAESVGKSKDVVAKEKKSVTSAQSFYRKSSARIPSIPFVKSAYQKSIFHMNLGHIEEEESEAYSSAAISSAPEFMSDPGFVSTAVPKPTALTMRSTSAPAEVFDSTPGPTHASGPFQATSASTTKDNSDNANKGDDKRQLSLLESNRMSAADAFRAVACFKNSSKAQQGAGSSASTRSENTSIIDVDDDSEDLVKAEDITKRDLVSQEISFSAATIPAVIHEGDEDATSSELLVAPSPLEVAAGKAQNDDEDVVVSTDENTSDDAVLPGDDEKKKEIPARTEEQEELASWGRIEKWRKSFPKLLQAEFVRQRLHVNKGWGLKDFFLLSGIFIVVSAILLTKKSDVARVFLMVFVFIQVPPIALAAKGYMSGWIWLEHRLELDDGLINMEAYNYGTRMFSLFMPMLGTFVGVAGAYLVFGLSFDTYVTQVLFSHLSYQTMIGISRTVCILVDGNSVTTVAIFNPLVLMFMVFSGTFISSWEFPEQLRWLFKFSPSFWGVGGSLMLQLDPSNPAVYNNVQACEDFLTCLTSDPRVISSFVGYAQETNQNKSFVVLLGTTLLFILLEHSALYLKKR